jgi:hypothetical protein
VKKMKKGSAAGGAAKTAAATAVKKGTASAEDHAFIKKLSACGKTLGGPNIALVRCMELPISKTECRYCGANWVSIIPSYASLDIPTARGLRANHCRSKPCKAAKTAYMLQKQSAALASASASASASTPPSV